MFEINVYSFLTSLIVSNLFIFAFIKLQKVSNMKKLSTLFFILLPVAALVRPFFPVEISGYVKAIKVHYVLPQLIRFLKINTAIKLPIINREILIHLYELLLFISLLVTLHQLVKLCMSYIHMYRAAKRYVSATDVQILDELKTIKDDNGYAFPVKIRTSHGIKSPYQFGFFMQRICLPDKEYSNDELFYILSHELFHHKNNTHWIKLLTNIFCCVFWFNPLMNSFYKAVETSLEIQCDEHVVNRYGKKQKSKYLKCLLNIQNNNPSKFSLSGAYFVNMNDVGKEVFEKRCKYIMSEQPTAKLVNYSVMLGLIFVFVLSYFIIVVPHHEPKQSDLFIPVFTEEDSYIKFEDGQYIVYFQEEAYIQMNKITPSFSHLPIIEE